MGNDTGHHRLGYRPALDGLRAVAILLVLAHHAEVPGLHGGWAGVDLFFVLSGFLITTLLLEEHATHGRVSLADFYRRRARRLLPALIPVLLVVTLYATTIADGLLRRDLLTAVVATATYWMNWLAVTSFGGEPLGHAWSLAIEEQFYLLWPLVLVALPRKLVGWFAAVGVTAAITIRIALSSLGVSWTTLYTRTDTRADALLIGCLAAIVFTSRERWLPWCRPVLGPAATVGAVGFAAVAVFVPASEPALYRFGLTGLAASAAVVILALVVNGPPRIVRVLSSAPLIYVGRRSYALYLWHGVILWVVNRHTSAGLGWITLAVVLSFVAAEVSWRVVEERWLTSRADGAPHFDLTEGEVEARTRVRPGLQDAQVPVGRGA